MRPQTIIFSVAAVIAIITLTLGSWVAYKKHQSSNENLRLGIVQFKNGQYVEAIANLEPYILVGEKSACMWVGLAYGLGLGTELNSEKARKTMQYCPESAGSNYFWVGERLEEAGTERDHLNMALEWYRDAAKLGSKSATLRLAKAYKNGELGLVENKEKHAYWEEHAKTLD